MVGAGNLFWSSASKGSRLGEAALARGLVSGCRTQPREQAIQDTALLDGLLHNEPVLARLPGGRPACVRSRHLVQDLQLGNLLPHLRPVVVAPEHLQGGECGRPGSGGPFRPALAYGAFSRPSVGKAGELRVVNAAPSCRAGLGHSEPAGTLGTLGSHPHASSLSRLTTRAWWCPLACGTVLSSELRPSWAATLHGPPHGAVPLRAGSVSAGCAWAVLGGAAVEVVVSPHG